MIRHILSVDGGGIRGLLPALLLDSVEQKTGSPCSKLFDMVSGTSTGGIIAAGLFHGCSARTMVQLYLQHGGKIFERTLWSKLRTGFGAWAPKYDPAELEYQLESVLGITRLSYPYAKTELVIPTYCIRLPGPSDIDGDGVKECASSMVFRSTEARKNPTYDFELAQICRATSAAPTFFPAAHIVSQAGDKYVCIDGGVYANNPAALAYVSASRLWPQDDIRVISLGTGSAVRAIPGSGNFGALQWAPHIMGPAMDGVADSVSSGMREHIGSRFTRCEIAMTNVHEAFDDASPDNIKLLTNLAQMFATSFTAKVVKALEEV